MPVAVIEGEVVFYIRSDHIDRPVFANDGTGTIVWEASYLPFGGVHTTIGTPTALRFPGQWLQSESALHQNWMRDYDPTAGRYMQADPLGLVDGASVYGYVEQNPENWIDPFGQEKKKFKKPENPNRKKGAEDRQKSGERERNKKHPEGEEHSRRPKGGIRPRLPFTFFLFVPPSSILQLCQPENFGISMPNT